MAGDPPAGDAGFRGGFRLLPRDGGSVEVDVWGADLIELLPRTAEAVARAAGVPEAGRTAETLTLDVGSDTETALVASVVANALSSLAEDGFYVEAASCRALATADAESGYDVRFAARLVCRGLRVDAGADPGLLPLAEDHDDLPRVWREGGLVRARVRLHPRGDL